MAVQMIIDDYPFSIATAEYDSLRRSLNWRWVQRDRLNRKPSLQYQGPGLIEHSLSGVIHVQNSKGLQQPEKMEAVANKGEPVILLASHDTITANYHGLWIIETMSFDSSDLKGDGIAETIAFEMLIKEYGQDDV